MRFLKIMLITMILGGVSILALGCGSDSNPVPTGQVATVKRGDLKIDITGVGNLALSQKVDLAFDIPSSFSTVSNPLSVEQVLVQEADSVEEGQLLAKLDTSAWEEQLIALEDKVIAAERNVTTKQRAVTAAQRKVTDAERNVTTKERAVTTAERQVTAKKLDLLQAQANLNNAELALEQIAETSTDPLEIEIKELQVEIAKGRVADAKQAVADAATEGIADAKIAVADAKIAVEDAKIAVEDAKIAVEDAQKALDNAKKALDEARSASPKIIAPFTGFIIKVNVTGGEEVKKGTVAVTIADPTKFEAEVMVSEANILKVKLGGTASVQVEAVKGVSLPAKVTHISPTATIQSGVVNYKVKVELESLQPVTPERQPATGNISSGGQQQPRQQTQVAPPGGQPGQTGQSRVQREPTGQSRAQLGQMSAMLTEDFQLKEGLTVMVSIRTVEKNGVLLVPNAAIKTQGGQAYVQVQSLNATIEERIIQTGISDWQSTEVTQGLSEGEKVIVPKATATTPTTQQQQPPPSGGMFIPGVGRVR